MERQCANARQLAERLSDNPRIGRVHHPGLGSTNGRSSVVRRVLRAPHTGALVSIRLADDTREAAFRFMDNLKLCVRLTSLGDVLTSVSHPATSSHRSLSPEHRREMGITESLVRISVGIEDAEDIIRDVEQALEA
jgi:cystathionine beta-lyase/cystathionine gamma-synthase